MNLQNIWGEMIAILQFMGKAFLHLAPFLAISVPLSVALKRSGASSLIRTKLNANPVIAVALATLIGAVSPLCSCGVIPVIAAMLTSGVPLAPVMSFWLASPSMDPEILFLSAGSIGWPLALWRLGATFVMSAGAGLIVIALEKRRAFGSDYLKESIAGKARTNSTTRAADRRLQPMGPQVTSACGCGTATFAVRDHGCCAPANAVAVTADQADRQRLVALIDLARDAGRTAVSISLWMLLAFFLEALISRYFPTEAVAALLGKDVPWAIPLATAIGVPLYSTTLTSLGIVKGLLNHGMSGGAALSFLIGGAVTTIPAMAAVWGLVKPRVFLSYLGFAMAGSLIAGYAYQIVMRLMSS